MGGRSTATPNTKIRLFFVDAAFLAMTTFAVSAHAQLTPQGQTELTAPSNLYDPASRRARSSMSCWLTMPFGPRRSQTIPPSGPIR